MSIWLIILLTVIIGLLLISLLPLRYRMCLTALERFTLTFNILLARLPLLTIQIPRPGPEHDEPPAEGQDNPPPVANKNTPAQAKNEPDEADRHHTPPLQVIRLLLDPLLWEQVIKFLRSLYQVLRVRKFTLSGSIGFHSPMHTARATALLALLNSPRWDFSALEPVWTEDRCDLTLTATGSFTLIALGWRYLRFISDRDTRQKIKQIRALTR